MVPTLFRPSGFTLIELVVVLTIAGVATAVTLPAFARWSRSDAAGAAREVVTAYSAARDAATTRATRAWVTIDPISGQYRVVADGAPDLEADTLMRGNIRRDRHVGLPGVATPVTTSFDATGRARGRALLVADEEATYVITTSPWSGAVTVRRR